MQDIETKAIETFQKNLLFFQESQPELYKKIDALNLAIEKGYYTEKYSLEYKEGYFDVFDIQNKSYLYGSNSNEYATSAADSVDYFKKDNLFETFYKVYISEEDAQTYKDAPITDSSYSASAPVISYANKYAQTADAKMKKIYKYIFFGTGLGTHLSEIAKKIQSNVYFIVENDLELFRLSFFVTDYKMLTNNGAILYFSVFDDDNEFAHHAQEFFNEMFIYNQYIKYFAMLNFPEERIKDFQKLILGQGYLVFNYSALTLGNIRPLQHLKNGYKILNISTRLLENFKDKDKPFLILGAGPSLHNNITWLKENQNKFVIVAVSAMLSLLEQHQIKPDIVTHTHGFDDALPHVQKVKDISFFDETILLFSAFSTPTFLSYFKKKNIYLFQGTSTFKEKFSGLGSSNIGALTYGLLTKFGLKNIYLLGLDFALNQETGASHGNSHAHVKSIDNKKTNYDLEEDIDYINSAITIKGNFKEEVTTNLIFKGFLKQCELFNKIYSVEESKTYNLSDGAYIEGAFPLKADDEQTNQLVKLDKRKIHTELISIFEAHAEDFLNEEDKETLRNRLVYIQELKDILKEYKTHKYNSMEKLHHALLGLFINILAESTNKDAQELNMVFEYYLKYVSGYIFDIINTQDLENEKHLSKKLNTIVISQLEKIINFYEEYLKNYMKEMQIEE